MITDFPPSTKPAWRLVLHETLAFMATAALYPFGLGRTRRRMPRIREQRTTVFVHGFLCNPSVFWPMQRYLRRQGHGNFLPFSYPSTRGVEYGAVALHHFLKDRVRGGRVDLVCHSMGGLVARTYLQQLGGARRVDRCITLGTPHFGTYNAYWLPTRAGRDMRPGSPLLSRLHDHEAAADSVDFLSIIGGSDNLVIPRVFARHEREVLLPDLGHMAMLYAPTVWKLAAAHLAGESIDAVAEQRQAAGVRLEALGS